MDEEERARIRGLEDAARQREIAIATLGANQILLISRMEEKESRLEKKMDEMAVRITADIMLKVEQLLEKRQIGFAPQPQ